MVTKSATNGAAMQGNAMMCIASSSNVCGCGREMFLRPGQLAFG